MKYAFLLSLLLLATGLTGCVESDWSVNMTHTGTTVADDGDALCGYGDDEECHSVSVSVEVTGGEDFESNMFYWSAVGSSGGIYDAPMVSSGPDACSAGATCDFVLDFDVTNGDTLITLKYEGICLGDCSASASL